MPNLYYHGTPTPGISTLIPRNGVIYLTQNRTYALFYIRDLAINHVTCGVKNGVVVYDEQFPNQLYTLYHGRPGWLYICEDDGNFTTANDNWIVKTNRPVTVAQAEHISDAFIAIEHEISAGNIRVKRYEEKTDQERQDITDMMANLINKRSLLHSETPKARFMAKYFPQAWEKALREEAHVI